MHAWAITVLPPSPFLLSWMGRGCLRSKYERHLLADKSHFFIGFPVRMKYGSIQSLKGRNRGIFHHLPKWSTDEEKLFLFFRPKYWHHPKILRSFLARFDFLFLLRYVSCLMNQSHLHTRQCYRLTICSFISDLTNSDNHNHNQVPLWDEQACLPGCSSCPPSPLSLLLLCFFFLSRFFARSCSCFTRSRLRSWNISRIT